MHGSCRVKCKVLYRIPFDVEKHAVGLERDSFLANGLIPEKQGQIGYIIKYKDPLSNEHVKCWVPLHKVQLNVQHLLSSGPPSRA
jgi:hypothetical protein